MIIEEFIPYLITPIQSPGKTGPSYKKRLNNILWIEELERPANLVFNRVQHQLIIKQTESGENILIQYPGKESIREKGRRPWDFRPKWEQCGDYGPDLGFNHIWAFLFNFDKQISGVKRECLQILGVLFYRMAFMMDHHEAQRKILRYETDGSGANRRAIDCVDQSKLLLYEPKRDVIKNISIHFNRHFQMSFEAFLSYNELLAWNEDCKYYFREKYEKRSSKWIDGVGRVNNLLTHVSLICVILEIMPLSDFLGALQRGVVKPTNNQLLELGKGMIIK